MEKDLVRDAIRQLRANGERVTMRAVHGLTRGSMRDVHRLMREEAEFLNDEQRLRRSGEIA